VLRDRGDGRTRLITRAHAVLRSAMWVVLFEIGDFPMMRRMLLGIKQRAETTPATRRALTPCCLASP
jgi:hypothetical protein